VIVAVDAAPFVVSAAAARIGCAFANGIVAGVIFMFGKNPPL
jgi:hypothetical protein